MLRMVLFAFVAAASASVVHEGKCPEIKPVENFNVTAYQGVWYEISKTPNDAEKNGKCGQAEYKLDGEVVKVKNSHVVDGVQKYVEGIAKFAEDANKSAKLLVTLTYGAVNRESPLNIIATDYQHYAIAYTCKYDEKSKAHNDSVWVLSRAKKLEGDAKTAVDNFLKEHAKEIDASKLVQTDFSDEACKFTSSSAVTELQTNKQ
ncbi:bilin-binding protein-like [Achroia grisella]|uniref:bilin-binding protein-like n=1 Tax=Achroia grisella TaxID=688607 RepID=UPI0027D2C89B|nr:bilin-binding protein-like [Achroia grisella]